MPPSDALVIAVTTGLGVSVIAGLLSGICYILNQGVPTKRKKRPCTPWNCNVCQTQFRSIQGVLEVEKVVTCAKCNEKVCRVKCSLRDPQRGWICQACQQPETWFKGLLKAMHPSNTQGWFGSTKMDSDTIDELDEDLMELRKKEREQVRDFIERLVGSMLGGDLDDTSVNRIYNDKKYDALFARYHADLSNALTDLGSALHISISNLPITGQTPCTAHASLKLLIQRFIREAVELPELKKRLDHPALPEEYQSDRTYEDLLSTAIINKVVQNYQNEKRPHSSAANSVCSRASSSTKRSDKEYFFSEETLEAKWKPTNHDETSSTSSLDEWHKSDSSLGSSKFVDRVSLTIKQQIEEGSSSDEGSRRSRRSQRSSLLKPAEETWNDNWFLQKRIAGTHSPVPVPMLVPNPTVEAKVLIGDKDAEDTSDLSDAGSDFGDTEVVPDIKNILVNSRTIIGGKNVLEKAVVDVTEAVSPNQNDEVEGNETVEVKALPENVVKEDHVEIIKEEAKIEKTTIEEVRPEEAPKPTDGKIEDASLLSLDSNTEQDTEYTEQYGSLPRTILKSPKPTPRASKFAEPFKEQTDSLDGQHFEQRDVQDTLASDGDVSESSDDDGGEEKLKKSFKGSYSEREKEKWKHAVEIPNNPYAPEKLESRLSNRSDDSASSLFGRDYYIREASRSAGARKKSSDQSPLDFEPVDLIDFDDGPHPVEIESSEPHVVTAIPVLVQSEEDEVDACKTPTGERLIPSSSPTQKEEDANENANAKKTNKKEEEEEEKPVPNWNSFPLYAPGEDDSLETSSSVARPNHLEISSDSDLSIERIYNLESGRVIQKVGQISQEIVIGSKSPEGIRYTPKEFDEDFHFKKTIVEDPHFKKTIDDEDHHFKKTIDEDPHFTKKTVEEDFQFKKTDEADFHIKKTIVEDPHFKKTIVEDPHYKKTIDEDPHFKKTTVEDFHFKKTVNEDLHFKKTIDENFKKTVDENHNDTRGVQAKKRQFLRSLTHDEDDDDDEIILTREDTQEVPYPPFTKEKPPNKLIRTHQVEVQEEEVIEKPPDKLIRTHQLEVQVEEEVIEVYLPPKSFGEMKKLVQNKEVKTSDYSEEDVLSESKDFSLEYSTDLGEEHETTASPSDSLLETDPEILDLKEKKLVKDVLGKLSKSFPNLSTATTADGSEEPEDQGVVQNRSSSPEPVDMPSVRNLKKLFDKESVLVQPKKDQKQVHSLTARSISRQFRQELKSTDDETVRNEHSTVNGSVVEQEVEEEELPMDITRNRIAFFEQLRKT